MVVGNIRIKRKHHKSEVFPVNDLKKKRKKENKKKHPYRGDVHPSNCSRIVYSNKTQNFEDQEELTVTDFPLQSHDSNPQNISEIFLKLFFHPT